MKFKRNITFVAQAAILFGAQVQGELVVYEGFDYIEGEQIWSQSGGDGWESSWAGTDTDAAQRGVPSVGAGLGLGSLAVSGGSYVRPQRYGVGESSRTISAASQAELTADASTVWFSVLMKANPGGTNGGYAANSHGAIVFGDTAFVTTTNPGTVPPAIDAGGNAVGVSFDGDGSLTADLGIQGVSYSGGVVTAWTDDRVVVGGDTVMIVGQIDWAVNGTDDVVSLYQITDPSAVLPAAFTTMTVDLDQSTFNLVALAQGQTEMFDEIRFGTSLEDVSPLDTISPAPNPMTFAAAPAAISDTEVAMTATVATSDNPVEYLFTNTTLATDSGWQASETYTATGLTPDTPYSFTVAARETVGLAETGASASATTWTFPEVIGDEILATVFADRVVVDSTATITDFTVNGVSAPGSLTANSVPGSTITVDSLFDTAAAQNHFAPQTNTNSAHWQVDVPLAVEGAALALGNIELSVRSFNSNGQWKVTPQTTFQNHYITVELLDSSSASLGSQQIFATEGIQYDYTAKFTGLKGITLDANESYTLSILVSGLDPTTPANEGNYVGLDAIRVLTEAASGSPFDDWLAIHFPGEDDVAIIGPDADPDNDGVLNLAEYGLNSDPNDPSDQPMLEVTTDETNLTLVYPTVAAATDISYTVEWSTDLEEWSTDGLILAVDPFDEQDADYPFVEVSLGKGADAAKFIRVAIEQL